MRSSEQDSSRKRSIKGYSGGLSAGNGNHGDWEAEEERARDKSPFVVSEVLSSDEANCKLERKVLVLCARHAILTAYRKLKQTKTKQNQKQNLKKSGTFSA